MNEVETLQQVLDSPGPSWSSCIPGLIACINHGTPEQRALAGETLAHMAFVADIGVQAMATLIRFAQRDEGTTAASIAAENVAITSAGR